MNQKKLFDDYALELKAVEGVTATFHDEDGSCYWLFTPKAQKALPVKLYYQQSMDIVGLDIEGVDCGYWHTDEHETLGYHIGLAAAALLGKIAYNQSPIFHFKEVCFYVDNAWHCTLTEKAAQNYHYFKKRKKLRD